jgi:homocysteine S-methyltransferase
VEVDVALDPAHLGLLGAIGKVFEADGITDLSQ